MDSLPELQSKWIAVSVRRNEFDDVISMQLEATTRLVLIIGNLVEVVGPVWPPIIMKC